tara:strand:+ start:233 stop:418 length:186 start_codon:yes stop_codon:yes gene_type:complete
MNKEEFKKYLKQLHQTIKLAAYMETLESVCCKGYESLNIDDKIKTSRIIDKHRLLPNRIAA